MKNKIPPFLKTNVYRIALVAILVFIAAGSLILFNPTREPGKESLDYRLKWLVNPGFVGDLYANTYGYYRNENLTVEVSPGGPDRDGLVALLKPNSKTRFAVASADQVISAVYRGGTDLRVVAQIYAGNPVQWIYRADQGLIERADQLRGKRIGVAFGDNDSTVMRAYLAKNGIKESEVTLVGIRFDHAPFTKNQVDLFPVYTNTQGVELRRLMAKEQVPVAFFDPSKGPKGVRFAANSIVTTTRMVVGDEADVTLRFLRATLRGWRDAIDPENLERATHAVQLATGDAVADPESIQEQIRETAPLVRPSSSYSVGRIDVAAWRETEETMLEQGLLDKNGVRPKKIGIDASIADLSVEAQRSPNK